jgi:hypothetical protein
MDVAGLLVVLVLVILFAGISATGALRLIAAASEKTAADAKKCWRQFKNPTCEVSDA